MDKIEAHLKELGYALPEAAIPAANYLPYRISGKTIYVSGVLPMQSGQLKFAGSVGDAQSVEAASEAARLCALNALVSLKAGLGSLDRIRQILLVQGFVNAVAGFAESPKVINGASDFLVEVLGEPGKHARAAIAVSGLPLNATVEIQITAEFA